ncbi:hypothetical protein ABZX30_17850 [Streptomyces sp. NPDC004542]|uniref:SCO2400 family protein n=1 Tax=Streptomyces sp. NPDC004542 TaxID=3154281 RepID=UPI0033ACEC96
MDYCSSCRRHLNGALMCPGCGAYAPDLAADIATLTAGARGAEATTGTAAWEATGWEAGSGETGGWEAGSGAAGSWEAGDEAPPTESPRAGSSPAALVRCDPRGDPTLVVGLPGSGSHQVALDDGQFAECDNKVTVTAVSAARPS